jgi:2-keto-4-pentenoate hydratase/2-oxohepta-3-ene-1,7-dioic acid hydratase in catechol pathway
MYLIRFEWKGQISVGISRGDTFVDMEAIMDVMAEKLSWHSNYPHGSMRRFLDLCLQPGAGEATAETIALFGKGEDAHRMLKPAEECRLLPPVHDPGKIICVGLNYAGHAAEQNRPLPESPILFSKFSNCLVGPNDKIVLPSLYTQQVDYEVELAVVIGRRAKEVSEEDALDYIAGYTILNDITARDFQKKDGQWLRGKSCDTFAPLGPMLVTGDEIKDPHNLNLSLSVNGEERQSSNTGDMIFKIPFLVSYISRTITLEPGDILSTGTPQGVGVFRQPPVFLQHGDVMEARIEKIGGLINIVDGGMIH